MSFTARTWPDIVRDLLMVLTQGVVGESLLVPAVLAEDHLFFLSARPIRRISRVEGRIAQGDTTVPWVFGELDWELVSSSGRPGEFDALRFRPRRSRPAPGTALKVSYWPRELPPLPLTDLNVGSVTRTLLETVGRELAEQYAWLDRVYRSAFLETAEGSSLDKVVALVGLERIPAAVPRGKVRFYRKSGVAELVNLPPGTAVLAGKDARYLTTRPAALQPGESSIEVPVVGEGRSTPVVEAGQLDRIAQSIAGIERVSNETATWKANEPETDEALRARARGAFHGLGTGTLDALRFAVGGLDFVNSVQVRELFDAEPGVVELDVAMAQPDDAVARAILQSTIDRVRPLGIQVRWGPSAAVPVVITVRRWALSGGSRPASEIQAIGTALGARLVEAVRALPPGGRLPAARALALALSDERIADVELAYTVNGAAAAEVALPSGRIADVKPPALPAVELAAGAGATAVILKLRVHAPLVLGAGTTLASARTAFRAKVEAWLGTALTAVDFAAFAAAVRQDGAWTLVRDEAVLVLEVEGRFEQVLDDSPPRPLGAGERLELASVDVSEWEGG